MFVKDRMLNLSKVQLFQFGFFSIRYSVGKFSLPTIGKIFFFVVLDIIIKHLKPKLLKMSNEV